MLARLPRASMGHAVALNAPEAHVCLPPATLLESTLVEVFFLNNLNVLKMNHLYWRAAFCTILVQCKPL